MVNAVEQCFDGIGQRCGVKTQQHFNRLGEFYKFDLVDGIFHAVVEAVSVRRVCDSVFGIGEYHVTQEHRGHELAVAKAAR